MHMPDAVHSWDIQRLPLCLQQPAERPVFVRLTPAIGWLLVVRDGIAVAGCSTDIAVGDLQRSCSPRRITAGELRRVDIEHPWCLVPCLEHWVVVGQQVGAALFPWID